MLQEFIAMRKNITNSMDEMRKSSTELIVYQLGEVKNLITTLSSKVDINQEKIERRVSALEIWKAGEEEKGKGKEDKPFDMQKIVLGAFGIASGAIALGLALIQSGVVK